MFPHPTERAPMTTSVERDATSSPADTHADQGSVISRRGFFTSASAAGLAALSSAATAGDLPPADGTPEQIHLTWGDQVAASVFVSWASAAQAISPRVVFRAGSGHERTVHAVQKTYTDGLNGQTVFTYHAHLRDLPPNTEVTYWC